MIILKNQGFFKDAIEALSAFIPEGNFRFNDKGIFFRAVDPSQVVLVDYFIDKKLFDEYKIEPNFIGLDIVEFNKLLSRTTPKDKLIMDLTDNELKVKFESELKRSFKLPLIDVNEEEAKIPNVEYDTKLVIGSVSLREMLKDASIFSSSVVLKVKDKKFFVEAKGTSGTMDSEATSVSKIESKSDVTAKFSLNFLQNIVKEADQGEKIEISLKADAPMKVSYNIGKSKIVFYLAHMIL
jgi:proliferating cell nuclear antigen